MDFEIFPPTCPNTDVCYTLWTLKFAFRCKFTSLTARCVSLSSLLLDDANKYLCFFFGMLFKELDSDGSTLHRVIQE
jgi:hypothetical protein